MERNLNSTRGLIVAEAVMMELAPHTGRQKAHDIIYQACRDTIESESGDALLDTLSRIPEVFNAVPGSRLEELCTPANYLGAATRMVDDVLDGRKVASKD